MSLFKKKDVPEELPGLAIDEITHKINSSVSLPLQEEKKLDSAYKPLPKQTAPIQQHLPAQPPHIAQNAQVTTKDEVKNNPLPSKDDKGFFKDIIKTVTEETDNFDKLDNWYKKEFLPGDLVYQMREYWEKQNPEVIIKNISGDLKDKLMEKTEKLHKLEKEWQEIYFDMLTKEEEIRKEEKELKTVLSDFITIFKNSMGKHKKSPKN
jgi:hypothetical protein